MAALFFCSHVGRKSFIQSTPRWRQIFVRHRRGSGCEVNLKHFQHKLEKELTKFAAVKHGIQFTVPTASGQTDEVIFRIRKKKKSGSMVGDRRKTALTATVYPYIRDILDSGELGDEYTNLGVVFTRMEMLSNSAIRLYYYCKSGDDHETNEEMEAALQRVGSRIKESLAAASVFPTTPPVSFALDQDEILRRRMEQAFATLECSRDDVQDPICDAAPSPKRVEKPMDEKPAPWKKKKKSTADESTTELNDELARRF